MYFLWTPKESTKEKRRCFRSAGHGQGGASDVRPGGANNRTSGSAMPTGGARCAPPSGRPWIPKDEGRGRACLKNRQDTFFNDTPTRSRLTAPPKNSPPGRGGVSARNLTAAPTYRVTHPKSFPHWGRLSPQVTDEGATAGHFPLIRRAGAPPLPKGGRLWCYATSFIKPCPRGGHTTS